MTAKPLCWTGDKDASLPGCGGCRYSIMTGGDKRVCQERHDRFYAGPVLHHRVRSEYLLLRSRGKTRLETLEILTLRHYPLRYGQVRRIVRQLRPHAGRREGCQKSTE